MSKLSSTTDLFLNYNRILPGNSPTESLTTNFWSTESSQLELESTRVPVPAIVVPVIISLLILILVIGALLLRWKR